MDAATLPLEFGGTVDNSALAEIRTTLPPQKLTISGGDTGCLIEIDLQTGTVLLTRCAPDRAAMEFWHTISRALHDVRGSICQQKPEQ